jgi:TRAP-type C4-dicarboxylate transport system permease small subunit
MGCAIGVMILYRLSQHDGVMETTNALPEFKHKTLHLSDEVHVIMFCGFMPSKMSNRTVMREIVTQSKQAVMPVKHSNLIGSLPNDQLL